MDLHEGTAEYSLGSSRNSLKIYTGDLEFIPARVQGIAAGHIHVLSTCASFVRVSKGCLRFATEREDFVLESGRDRLVAAQAGVELQDQNQGTNDTAQGTSGPNPP